MKVSGCDKSELVTVEFEIMVVDTVPESPVVIKFPVTAGTVKVKLLAVEGTSSVTDPPPVEFN